MTARGLAYTLTALCLGMATPILSEQNTLKFSQIDAPSADGRISLWAIGNDGVVLGSYFDLRGAAHYFQFAYGFYKTIDFPNDIPVGGSRASRNDRGQIAGSYYGGGRNHGYFFDGKKFHILDFPGAAHTFVLSINNGGQIGGIYSDAKNKNHALLFQKGKYKNIDPPGLGTASMISISINNLGHIAGCWSSGKSRRSYLYKNGIYTFLQSTTQINFAALGLNDRDDVIGNNVEINTWARWYRWSHGTYQKIQLPETQGPVSIAGINNQRQLVGFMIDLRGKSHGLIIAP
ncbi:MAG: hypothetical protein JWQ02_1993 [Capsulimonas sp.]|nr:hypothetical protein [Capsulimonas sp.]